ncbi:MAG: glycosyltransferase family 39 protein [Proteobacteria bacterium]|nr:glycosyltransferase family 39 protein [Pseudomonadota bacterium]
MKEVRDHHGVAAVVVAWAVLAATAFAFAAPRTDAPGLYYDEAFMAQQARDFLEPERATDHAGSIRELWIAGRPFPLRNAVYLGSLKSQLLIPSFAIFGAEPSVLRLTTLGWSLLAVLFVMLFARRIVGTPAAIASGALLIGDPAWYFYSLHEWGPFTTGLLCRGAGLWLVTLGWSERRVAALAAGGLALGLGVYNRADFAVILAAAALALAAAAPAVLREAWRERRRDAVILLLALAVGAAPMLVSAGELLATGSSAALESRGGLEEKLRVLGSLLDGSRFYRVIDQGGLFPRMHESTAPASLLPWLLLAAAVAAAWRGARRTAGGRAPGAETFLLLAALLTSLGMLAVPGAVRAHHLLNALPFPHLLLASVSVRAWRAAGSRPAVRTVVPILIRLGLVAALAALAISSLRVSAATYALIDATGGRGRFSTALHDLAREIDGDPEQRVVSLDWGFHEPLLFLTDDTVLVQPLWRIPLAVRQRGAWTHDGQPGDLYLVHADAYDLFGHSARFLRTAQHLGEREPGAVELRDYRDREGSPVFTTIRITRPHRIVLRPTGFRIE